jgi:flagellar biosynthesis protein FlhG
VNKFLNIDLEYMGAIPYDANMQRAVMRQEPISIAAPNTAAARSVARIAGILTDTQEESPHTFGIMQLFSRVIRMKFK